MQYGATYLRLRLEGVRPQERVVLSFEGASDTRWALEALRTRRGEPAIESSHEVPGDGRLEVTFDSGDRDALVLAIVNLGKRQPHDYTPDFRPVPFTYGLRIVDDPGEGDAGQVDAGPSDAGAVDAGAIDTGVNDGGLGADGGSELSPPPSGCGCAAPEGFQAWLASALLMLRRRRRA